MIRILTNFNMDSSLVLAVVLAGQHGLAKMLARDELQSIAKRLAHCSTLRLLSRDETVKYLEHRCAVAGTATFPLDQGATESIYELTRGNLRAIDSLALRLDLENDRTRLVNSIDQLRPRLLLLDPLVRLHRADENSSAEISALLGFLREIQRQFNMAVILVHHMSKKHRAQLGQSLRGSSDLHAFGDCNAYLVKKNDKLFLSVEHRFAPTSEPLHLALVSDDDGSCTHLEIAGHTGDNHSGVPLAETVSLTLADADRPLTRVALRKILCVNNQRLGMALGELEKNGIAEREPNGWILKSHSPKLTASLAQPSLI